MIQIGRRRAGIAHKRCQIMPGRRTKDIQQRIIEIARAQPVDRPGRSGRQVAVLLPDLVCHPVPRARSLAQPRGVWQYDFGQGCAGQGGC